MSKKPEWPERRFARGTNAEGEPCTIVVRPWSPLGPVHEELGGDEQGIRVVNLPAHEIVSWLQVYYLEIAAEVLHESNELFRAALAARERLQKTWSRLAFWRGRGKP